MVAGTRVRVSDPDWLDDGAAGRPARGMRLGSEIGAGARRGKHTRVRPVRLRAAPGGRGRAVSGVRGE